MTTVFSTHKNHIFENLGTREAPMLAVPFGPEIYFSKIDSTLLSKLQSTVMSHNFQKKYNGNLAGMIKQEYEIDFERELRYEIIKEVRFHMNNMVKFFIDTKTMEPVKSTVKQISTSPLWINFQKKHEFNPPHQHGGVYSFVLYVNIPEEIKQNHKTKDEEWQFNCKGLFEFRHNETSMNLSPSTGDIILFPSALTHGVYPYDCDVNDDRISISGNIESFDME